MSDIHTQTLLHSQPVEAPRDGVAPCSPLLTDYVQKEQLAQEFGVSQRTIERWVRLRLLPSPLRLGRKSFHHLPSIRKHLTDRAECGSRYRRGR
jgi:hypothetical protein